jgi:outer membrane lipoprotein SlyB
MKLLTYLGLVFVLLGCASKPQIIVDPYSITDQEQYENDASECLTIARSYDLTGATSAKVVGGALIGGATVAGIATAVAGAVFAPAVPFIVAGGLAGGGLWGASSSKEERKAREKIMVQCLNERGYKSYETS